VLNYEIDLVYVDGAWKVSNEAVDVQG